MMTKKEKKKSFKKNNKKGEISKDDSPVAKKSLGQNFLDDQAALDLIVKTAGLKETDNVLEIGPGTGLLTDELIKIPKKVFCIEKDRRMVKYLAEKYFLNNKEKGNKKLEITEADILEMDLPKFLKERGLEDYKIVANIPYYITGKILRLLLETKTRAKVIVLLVQKEVAERVCVEAGAMNILAVAIQYYAQVSLAGIVPKEAFSPVPKVDSAIIFVVPFRKDREKRKLEKEFFKVVKSGFSSPRKKVLSNLVFGLNLDKQELIAIFQEFKWNENLRAQNFSIEQWKKLRDRLSQKD